MKRFHFTLEALGTLRKRQEQRAMDAYAQSLASRTLVQERLAAVRRDLEACWLESRARLRDNCAATEMAQIHAYQQSLALREEAEKNSLALAEQRVDAALDVMLHARRQREIVDKFFEKQKALHRRELAQGEQKFLDDLAGRRGNSVFAWKPSETPL
jgi:flagellar export protein FliJ